MALYFSRFFLDFPASESAIATACFWGRPECLSSAMFCETTLFDLPFFSGIKYQLKFDLPILSHVKDFFSKTKGGKMKWNRDREIFGAILAGIEEAVSEIKAELDIRGLYSVWDKRPAAVQEDARKAARTIIYKKMYLWQSFSEIQEAVGEEDAELCIGKKERKAFLKAALDAANSCQKNEKSPEVAEMMCRCVQHFASALNFTAETDEEVDALNFRIGSRID